MYVKCDACEEGGIASFWMKTYRDEGGAIRHSHMYDCLNPESGLLYNALRVIGLISKTKGPERKIQL
ncbi:MAG: hypothetical protein HY518_02615 [Candidatus Aenigmarchaeota archaeon]|nr:hypothetical protein [Candidatus Aenigmarchaeota archaeon]